MNLISLPSNKCPWRMTQPRLHHPRLGHPWETHILDIMYRERKDPSPKPGILISFVGKNGTFHSWRLARGLHWGCALGRDRETPHCPHYFFFRPFIQEVSSLAPRGLILPPAQRSWMESSLKSETEWMSLHYDLAVSYISSGDRKPARVGWWVSVTQQILRWKVRQRLALLILSRRFSSAAIRVSPLCACAPASIHKHTQVCTFLQPQLPGLTQPG